MTTKRSRFWRSAATVAAGSLILGACGSAEGDESGGTGGSGDPGSEATEAGEGVAGGSAVFAVDSPFLGFDPNVTAAAQDARVLRQVFDSLLYLDDEGGLQPWLATEWTVSDDGLEYTFTVRDDVTFTDGTPFDATAICFNLDRIKDPASASIYAIGLIGPYESCTAGDPTTAVVTMSTPYAPFLNNLTSPFMGINSPTAAAAAEPADYTLAPVGSGPFSIVSYTPNDRVELVRNDDYAWAPGNATHTGAAYLENLTFQIIPDPTVRIGSVRNGTVNVGSNVPETDVAAIEGDPNLAFLSQQQSGAPYQLHFNASRAPFDELAVREAARAAMDIDSAVNALYLGVFDRAWGPLAPTTLAYDPSVEGSFSFDADEAGRLLDEAGWVLGSDGVRTRDGERLRITYLEGSPNREKRQDVATFLAANLEAVGFEVETQFQQVAPLQAQSQAGDYDIMGLSLVAVDPNVLYQMYDPRFIPSPGRSGFNLSHTDDDAVTGLVNTGQQQLEPDARAEIYVDAQADVIEQVRSVAIYVPTYTLAVNGLQGIRFDAEGYPILYDASLTQ
ncbi:ABC transporter substrate-binding protein [Occultella gossypii]|uniref:ABC transporter substrate-binding protein n=1 Tax=Occultella gossypii TaxID=2800820 RepID=A0ABS7S3Y0_9MICO|nr:ABC transporter substrate-binding protein [Occultella gossypii]MBZ2195007.1 ABC transporter substrate-binding protein [Occultella gossypii]